MVRALLICLLALALPMQGAVAAAGVFCGLDHHAQRVVAADAAHADAAAPGHALAAQSHDLAGAHEPTGLLAADGAAAASDVASAEPNPCSVCAACCSPAVIHEAPLELPVGQAAGAPIALVVSEVEACAASGPERPPRADLA